MGVSAQSPLAPSTVEMGSMELITEMELVELNSLARKLLILERLL